MSLFDKAAAAAGAIKSVFTQKNAKSAAGRAKETAKAGIDILEAASVNREHPHIPASHPGHLKYIFGAAAVLGFIGVVVPVASTGLTVSAIGIVAMEGAKFLAYRGLRVTMPYGPQNGAPQSFGRKLLDFYEAATLNRSHAWMNPTERSGVGSTFTMAGAGLIVGVALTASTVGLPALAGVLFTEFGKMAAYRGYRVLVPYRDGHTSNLPVPDNSPG